MKVSDRKRREISALVDASYEALLETVKASKKRQAKRQQMRAATAKAGRR